MEKKLALIWVIASHMKSLQIFVILNMLVWKASYPSLGGKPLKGRGWFQLTPERYAFFDSIRYLAFLFDTIRYFGLRKNLLFEEFSANFQNFRQIFGWFLEFWENFRNFRRFSESSENFRNFGRTFGIFGEKIQKKSISPVPAAGHSQRYNLWNRLTTQ